MLRRRMKSDKGFTLAELLIVVAIIAVLVAVSIPIFNAQLEKSREATDIANFRAAKAAVIAYFITNSGTENFKPVVYYDADRGIVTDEISGDASSSSVYKGYGQGTTAMPYDKDWYDSMDSYNGKLNYRGSIIKAVFYTEEGKSKVIIKWEDVEEPGLDLDLSGFEPEYNEDVDGDKNKDDYTEVTDDKP